MIDCAISLDVGTSSLKLAVIDVLGNVLFHKRFFFATKLTSSSLFSYFIEALDKAVFFTLNNALHPLGIAVSGNGPSIIACDKFNRENDFLFMWNEKVECAKINGSSSIFLPRLAHFKSHYKHIYENATFFLPLVEYLLFRLTEKKVVVLSEERFKPFYWEEDDLKLINFNKNLIPPFVELGYKIGNYKGIPLFAGPPDYVAALIGTASLFENTACDIAGSSEGINITVKEKPSNVPLGVRVMPSPAKGLWTVAVLFSDAGTRYANAVKSLEGRYSFKSLEITERFKEVMEVIYTSYFSKTKCDERFSEVYNIVISLLEDLKKAFSLLEEITNVFPYYSLSGGHAKNECYLNMKSFITKRHFNLLNHADAELLGNAILVFYKCALYSSLKDAARQTVKVVKVF